MKNSLSDYLEIWGIEEDTLVFQDGSLGAAFDLTPLDISCWEDHRVNQLAQRLKQFLNGLPQGLDIQFVQAIGKDDSGLIESHEKLGGTDNRVVEEVNKSRIERLKALNDSEALPKYNLRLLVRSSPSRSLVSRGSVFRSQEQLKSLSAAELNRQIESFKKVVSGLQGELESLGLEPSQLSADATLDLTYAQWNPLRKMTRPCYDPEFVRDTLVLTGAKISEAGFSLGDMKHRVISLKLLPEQTFASMAATLSDLPFNSQLALSGHVPDQQTELHYLQVQRRLAFSLARSRSDRVSDIDSQTKLDGLEDLLSQMIASGEKVFHSSLTITLKSRCEHELDEQVSETLMKLRELSGAEGMDETLAAFEVFCQSSIPNARAPERSRRIKTSNLADFLPIYGAWKGHTTPRILLRNRMGSVLPLDPFSPSLPNYNQIVSGGSGSGKSFLTNLLLLQLMRSKSKVFIIDIGGSYQKLTSMLGGQYIPVAQQNLSLNPFDLGAGETSPGDHKIKFLTALVDLMTREDGEPSLPRIERAEIGAAIQELYKKDHNPSLSALRESLLKSKELSVQKLGKILSQWCGDSPYGKILDRETTISLESSLVVFDLKGLESSPDLQAAILFIITDFVWREIQTNRHQPKFLVFDECWKLLESETGAVFIGEVFRTFRKYYASAIAISQNLDDFAKSRVANAILSNCATRWVLSQKGADQGRLRKALQLNESEQSLIASLSQKKGHYSEAFLMSGDDRGVAVIESTPLEYWLATTDPRDLAEIDRRLDISTTPAEAIAAVSQEYPRGVSNASKIAT